MSLLLWFRNHIFGGSSIVLLPEIDETRLLSSSPVRTLRSSQAKRTLLSASSVRTLSILPSRTLRSGQPLRTLQDLP